MSPEERTVLHEAFAKTTELFKTRRTARDWSDNIIEGSKSLTTPEAWKHYYVWLANPKMYNEAATDKLEVEVPTPECIKPYPKGMKVETFNNGNETIVRVINQNLQNTDDEKIGG